MNTYEKIWVFFSKFLLFQMSTSRLIFPKCKLQLTNLLFHHMKMKFSLITKGNFDVHITNITVGRRPLLQWNKRFIDSTASVKKIWIRPAGIKFNGLTVLFFFFFFFLLFLSITKQPTGHILNLIQCRRGITYLIGSVGTLMPQTRHFYLIPLSK